MDYNLKPLSCLLLVIVLVWGLSFPVSYGSDGFTLPVPEFTLNLQYKSIELKINNEPFFPYVSQDILPDGACLERGIEIYYHVYVKIYFDGELAGSSYRMVPSSSEFTVLWLPADYPDGARIEVNVQAEYFYDYDEFAGRPCLPLYTGVRVSSGENNTQTLTIHKNALNLLNSTVSLSKPSVPEFTAELLHNLTLVVRIKNEPFTVNYAGTGEGTVGYYYKLGLPSQRDSSTYYSDYCNRSTDEYTIKTMDLSDWRITSSLVVDGKAEVKVKAYAGELYSVAHQKALSDEIDYDYDVEGERRNWSDIQRLTV